MSRYSRRELPPYRHRPGVTPHPERHPQGYRYGVPVPEEPPLGPDDWHENEAYLHGADLFNAGYFWEAHASWEAVWNATPRRAPDSCLLQGLVQLAAAFLKRELDAPAGATKLLERALEKLRSLEDIAVDGRYRGIELGRFCGEAEAALVSGRPPPRIELRT